MKKNIYKKQQLQRRWVLTIFGSKLFSLPRTYKIKIWAYRKVFDIGENPIIEHGVWIQRTHGLEGKLTIGDRVLLARHVSIDYSGTVRIENDVWLSEGSQIHSHIHKIDKNRLNRRKDNIIPIQITLRKGCWIGANAIILPQTKEIGENSIVAAGSIVTRSVPNNVIVAGNPAKIIKQLENEI